MAEISRSGFIVKSLLLAFSVNLIIKTRLHSNFIPLTKNLHLQPYKLKTSTFWPFITQIWIEKSVRSTHPFVDITKISKFELFLERFFLQQKRKIEFESKQTTQKLYFFKHIYQIVESTNLNTRVTPRFAERTKVLLRFESLILEIYTTLLDIFSTSWDSKTIQEKNFRVVEYFL